MGGDSSWKDSSPENEVSNRERRPELEGQAPSQASSVTYWEGPYILQISKTKDLAIFFWLSKETLSLEYKTRTHLSDLSISCFSTICKYNCT